MPDKSLISLLQTEIQSLWRYSRRFIANPARVRAASTKSVHFSGGESAYKGSKCAKCKKRLTLLWDLDLQDPFFPDYVREGFSRAARLPFFICWQCMAASYSIVSETQVRCFPFDGGTEYLMEDESPFMETPEVLERRPISLVRIPTTIDALFTLADAIEPDQFDPSATQALKKYFGKTERTYEWFPISQLGGLPLIGKRHRNHACPNPKCLANQLSGSGGELYEPYLMKELAIIHWKDEPALAAECFRLLYYACGICFSLRAEYHCS